MTIDALERALNSLGWWLSFWTFIVVIGLIIEYSYDLNKLFRTKPFKRALLMPLVGALLIPIDVVGELYVDFRASSVETKLRAVNDAAVAEFNKEAAEARRDANQAKAQSDSFQAAIADANARARSAEAQVVSANAASRDAVAKVANADARIAEANRAAAEANRIAESERLARITIEEKIASRHLTVDQQEAVAKNLKRFAGQRLDIYIYSGDSEIIGIARDIIAALSGPNGAGWAVEAAFEQPSRPIPGILVEVRPREKQMLVFCPS